MKFLFDLFPIILFFIAFKFGDIYTATIVAMVATIGQKCTQIVFLIPFQVNLPISEPPLKTGFGSEPVKEGFIGVQIKVNLGRFFKVH